MEFLGDTLRYVKANRQVDMVHENLAQKLGNRLKNVKFETMGMLHSC